MALPVKYVKQALITSKTIISDIPNRLSRQKHAFKEFSFAKELALPSICQTNLMP